MSWWSPARHADRRPLLLARNRIKAALRALLERDGFTETDPGALCISPGNETHLHAFATEVVSEAGARTPLYLHTSPEFAMKKLLAAGEERIFTLAPVYRNREQGSPLHAPEFTMLEWYRAHAPYEALFEDCAAMLATAANAAGAAALRYRDRTCDPFAPPERLSVAEAFARYAEIDLLATAVLPPHPALRATFSPRGEGVDLRRPSPSPLGEKVAAPAARPDEGETPNSPDPSLAAECARIGVRVGADDGWSDLFSRVLVERIEPQLGIGRATILHSYPISEAALARPSPADPRLAERFELYACGVELANGFGELTDAAEQRRRFVADMDEKERLYGERYPIDEDFLAALAHMAPASGCALGFDRLVMLATGAARIGDVMWTPPVD